MSCEDSTLADKSDRLTFWRNWYTASRPLPDEMRLAWYDAVLDFAFSGIVPSSPSANSSVAEAVSFQAVLMVKSTIETSRKRREFGSRGGETRSKRQAKAKQNASKLQANVKQKPSKTQANFKQEQVQEQVQEQEQEHNAIMLTATARGKQPTIEQFVEGAALSGVPADFARQFYAELVANGWEDVAGRKIGNWRMYVRSAFLDSQKKLAAACDSQSELAAIPIAR